ncbi:helix-turn-helix domain-containing protein [Bacillus mojavensis]|uniref:helix-turn-helix domain-containing protein n=1 Tax=Bacillus mojavensis TaxID=72360 RepID=UPI002DBE04B0|nr:helix-turn-helix domain-containing protein [Bacillus mojavensis]MEC1680329.1 helix-turn-helix domain-containing protein [Bacillus mojavensis]MEC1712746.1 helix-turn-helix domain-containing protein [Bacillus mojavensis]
MNLVSEKNSKQISRDTIQQGKTLLSERLSNSDIQQEAFVHLSVKESYNFETDEIDKKVYLSLDKDYIAQGGLSNLHPSALKVLLVIAAHTDKDGFAWISQESIGKLVGLSRQQVGVIIHKHLMCNVYNGKKLLEAIKLKKKDGQEFYLYHPINCYLDYEVYSGDEELIGEYEDLQAVEVN